MARLHYLRHNELNAAVRLFLLRINKKDFATLIMNLQVNLVEHTYVAYVPTEIYFEYLRIEWHENDNE
ncbi:hypothetical protein BPAE_0180g00020 [Botrytis paeoniae]|uniref:Uncharacterized protein n=1 Tax=Botrytis paeoniae TaxID=278948 RepID=A0A4Z1FF52_9HELO|nr:hypothetical protein BPAE_0180g00020 [Botrytis paeoniae]